MTNTRSGASKTRSGHTRPSPPPSIVGRKRKPSNADEHEKRGKKKKEMGEGNPKAHAKAAAAEERQRKQKANRKAKYVAPALLFFTNPTYIVRKTASDRMKEDAAADAAPLPSKLPR